MAASQHRVAVFLHVEVRPAEPARQEQEELLARDAQRFRVQLADRAGLVECIHVVVEAVDEFAHPGLAADLREALGEQLEGVADAR